MRTWLGVGTVVCLLLVAAIAAAQGPCPYVKCPGATCGGAGKPCNKGCGEYECGYVGYSCATAGSGCKGGGCTCPTYCSNGSKPCVGTDCHPYGGYECCEPACLAGRCCGDCNNVPSGTQCYRWASPCWSGFPPTLNRSCCGASGDTPVNGKWVCGFGEPYVAGCN
jgi:hypothetical protein